jgi:predicted nucleic acid-binding protein
VFADSSAVVKLYAQEAGTDDVRAMGGPLLVSHLARVEVPAALWRKVRMGELDAPDAQLLSRAFEADLAGTPSDEPRFGVVALEGRVLDQAARLVPLHGLRAADAIQLASAIEARRAVPTCSTVACYDTDLRRAASAEGFAVTPSG